MALRYGVPLPNSSGYPYPSFYLSEFHLLPIIFSKLPQEPSKKNLSRPILVSLEEYVERARLPEDTSLEVLTETAHQLFDSRIVQGRKDIFATQTNSLFTYFQVCWDKRAVKFLFSPFAQENYDCIKRLFEIDLVEETYPFHLSPTRHFYWRLRHFHSHDFVKDADLALNIKGNLEVFGSYFNSTDHGNDLGGMLKQACQEINQAPLSVFVLDCQKNEDEESFTLEVRLAKEKITWQDLILEKSYIGHAGVPYSVLEANFGKEYVEAFLEAQFLENDDDNKTSD